MSVIRTIFCVFILAGLSVPAHASKTVTSAGVMKGESSAEWKGEYVVDDDDDRDGAWKEKLVLGHGVTEFWQTEVEATFGRGGGSGDDTEFQSLDWKNKIQFTDQKTEWLDTGIRVTYGFSGTGGADEIEVKFLGGKDFAKTAHRGNVIFSREVGEDSADEVEWGLSWSSRYKCSDAFQPGFELHSAFGEIGHEGEFDDQDHRLGPVFYGKIGKGFSYDAGYLFGISEDAPDGMVKAIVKYKW